MTNAEHQIPAEVCDIIANGGSVTVLTGAGVSAESGVPTFRDAQSGLWARYAPEELATPEAFRRDPRLVWEWYEWRKALVAAAKPNPGHLALVELERVVDDFTLITQNVDGLHAAAGSRSIIELHGNIGRVKCVGQGHIVDQWDEVSSLPPKCPRCDSLLRPDVVWFGESLPSEALSRAFQAAQRCELFLCVGTSAVVQPAATLPLTAARQGAVTVEINPEPTPISDLMSHVLRGPSAIIVPLLLAKGSRSLDA